MKHREIVQVVTVSLAGAFALSYKIPGNTFDADLWIKIFFTSAFTIFFLFMITYFFQKILASYYSGNLEYEFYPLGIVASVLLAVFTLGNIPFFQVGHFKFKKNKTYNVGTKKILESKVEKVSIAGISVLVGLFFATTLSFFNNFVVEAAIAFAIWGLIPIPKTNGYHWFDWHPANSLIILSFVAIIIIFYSAGQSMIIPLIIFSIYYFSYPFIHARRQNF